MTDRQAKAATMDWFDRICAGLVTWCMTPPEGVHSFIHRLTLLDAIQHAITIAEVKSGPYGRPYRVYAGGMVAAIIRTLPTFEPSGWSGGDDAFIGTLSGHIDVYLQMSLDLKDGMVEGNSTVWLSIVQLEP